MSARTSLAGALSVIVTGSVLALSAGAAQAAYVADPDDTTATPAATDFVGVGSDTSQHALYLLAKAYDGTSPAPAVKVQSFAATSGGDITLPGGTTITRPNGSGAGKGLLYGSANNPDIDFARSSSALSTTEVQGGLQAFPFALDTLGLVVSNTVASHAPVSLTNDQIVSIYNGSTTDWSQVGGTAGAIIPEIPQSGSGTRNFFEAQLKSFNGGVTVAYGKNVKEVQENDPSTIQSNPDVIAPYSVGRAGLAGSALRVEQGLAAKRALYDVVRSTSLSDATVQGLFGESGYVCSNAAADLIKQSGFQQLARADQGGVCGQATTDPTTNFTTNTPPAAVATATKVAGASTAPRAVRLTVTVAGSTTPTGTVTVVDKGTGTAVATNKALSGGVAVISLSPVTPGTHSYTATYTPTTNTGFQASTGTGSVKVKTTSSIKESFPAKVAKGKLAKGTVTVTLAGTATKATGKVTVKKGSKTLRTGTLESGKVTLTLPKLASGKNSLKISYVGDGNATGSVKTFTITQAK